MKLKEIFDSLRNKEIDSNVKTDKSITEVEIFSPISGRYIPLNEVEDKTFASGILGQGFAIEPASNSVFSPIDAKVTMLFPTLHAIGLTHDNGMEILIHVGLETVSLEGKPFKTYVKEGQRIKRGDKLLSFDADKIILSGCKLTTPVIITNSPKFEFTFMELTETIDNDTVVIHTTKKT